MKPNRNSENTVRLNYGPEKMSQHFLPGNRGGRPVPALVSLALLVFLLPLATFAAGPVVQLVWSTQPGSANIGSPFGQQPTLITADAAGNPSTAGLAGSVLVTIDTIPSGGLSGGAQTVDIGTSANNGVVHFSNLQINSAGGYQLIATAGNGTNCVLSPTNGISNCRLWLDAADAGTLTVTANNNLTFWADKSGRGNNATNVTANSIANTPYTNVNASLAAFAYGTQRVVSFNGTNMLNIDLTSITNSSYTIIALTELSPSVTANNDYYIGTPFLNPGVDRTLHIGYRNSTTYTFAQYADDLNVAYSSSGPLIASDVLGTGSNNRRIYLNGTLAGQNNANFLVAVSQGTIGQANFANFHGDMAEVIVYNTNLTDIQRVGVENYLANKWLGQFSGNIASSSFFVSGGSTPKGIKFAQQPTDAAAGVNISPAVAVTVTNSSGGGISGLTVYVSLYSGSGTLNGTLSQVTDGTGTASFGDLNFTVAGQKQLMLTVPGVVTNLSSTFNIVAAAPAQLGFQASPSISGIAGVPLSTQPVVAVEDSYGNVVSNVTDTITASETSGGDLNQLPGNAVNVVAVSGTATFAGIYLTNAGTSTLTIADTSLGLTLISAGIAINANVPASIAITQEPSSGAQVGVPFATQPVVSVSDVYGNAVTNGTHVIATAGATVFGDATETTTGGIATYLNLNVTNTGSITLTFTAGSVSANSTPISVSPGPAVTLAWTTQPGSALAGSPFGQQPVLKAVDAGGNVTTGGLGQTNWVVVHLISGGGLVGSPLLYNIGTSGSNGVISFSNLQINNPGVNDVLAADYVNDPTVPTNTIPNCILWLDAYDQSTLITSGTNLVQWSDKSGTGNNATNAANYPAASFNSALPLLAYGGQHTVSFQGNNWLDVDLSPLDGNTFTVFVVDVAGAGIANGNNYFFGSGYNGVDATLHMGYRFANTFTLAQYADDLNWAAPANFALSTPRLWTGRLDASAFQEIFLNGNMVAKRTAAAPPGTLINGSVGRANFANYNGDIAEMIVYNRDLSDSERQTVEQYLTQKWLSSSRGLSAPFTVFNLAASLNLMASGARNLSLTLAGAPSQSYRILSTTNLALPLSQWRGAATNTLNSGGTWQLTLTNNAPATFYRAVTP